MLNNIEPIAVQSSGTTELTTRHGPDAAFLHGLSSKHDLSEAVFLVDGFGYQTTLGRLRLSSQRGYTKRNPAENSFRRSNEDRPHPQFVGSQSLERSPLMIAAFTLL